MAQSGPEHPVVSLQQERERTIDLLGRHFAQDNLSLEDLERRIELAYRASDLPSLREWVRDGETGYLVDAQDASAVAARVCAVLEHPDRRRHVVQQARALVVDKASQAAHMSVMTGHYRRLATGR